MNPTAYLTLADRIEEPDWNYSMRREMQNISPGLYLGPYKVAASGELESLQIEGITHIVCVRHHLEQRFIRPNFQEQIIYLVLDLSDAETENLIMQFPEVNRFIDEALQQGGKVLVHGNGGTSRSAALVTAFIMQKYNLTADDAINHVQLRRFCVCMNEGFKNQLQEYEHIYKAQQQASVDSDKERRTSIKRKWEEVTTDSEMDCETSS